LPRKQEVIEPADLPQGSKKIGEQITEYLDYIPAQMYVHQIVRPKYVHPSFKGVKIAPLPEQPLEKSNAGAGLLAHLMISKWVDHLPYYRQRQIFKCQSIDIAPSTTGNWYLSDLVKPLY